MARSGRRPWPLSRWLGRNRRFREQVSARLRRAGFRSGGPGTGSAGHLRFRDPPTRWVRDGRRHGNLGGPGRRGPAGPGGRGPGVAPGRCRRRLLDRASGGPRRGVRARRSGSADGVDRTRAGHRRGHEPRDSGWARTGVEAARVDPLLLAARAALPVRPAGLPGAGGSGGRGDPRRGIGGPGRSARRGTHSGSGRSHHRGRQRTDPRNPGRARHGDRLVLAADMGGVVPVVDGVVGAAVLALREAGSRSTRPCSDTGSDGAIAERSA